MIASYAPPQARVQYVTGVLRLTHSLKTIAPMTFANTLGTIQNWQAYTR
jgi:hypothetical protein